MYCSKCGAEIGEKDLFCTNCGGRIARQESDQTVVSEVKNGDEEHTETYRRAVERKEQNNQQSDLPKDNPVIEKRKKKRKRFVIVLAVIIGAAFLLVFCGGRNQKKSENHVKTEFNQKQEITCGGLSFQIPATFAFVPTDVEFLQSYVDNGASRAIGFFEGDPEVQYTKKLFYENIELEDSMDELAKSAAPGAVKQKSEQTEVAGCPAIRGQYMGKWDGIGNAYIDITMIGNNKDRKIAVMFAAGLYSEKDEVEKLTTTILETAQVLENVKNADSISDKTKTTAPKSDGVDPKLKEFLDSYETFYDEYIVFMKSYTSGKNTDVIGMLSKYTDIMTKYTDFAEKLGKIDANKLSGADYAYYMEVTTRVTKKLLEAGMN